MSVVASPSPETQAEPVMPYVVTGTIISVDPSSYTMRVRSYFGETPPIEIPSVFMNIRDGRGAGIHFMPEVGSSVWLCKTSDGTYTALAYHGAIGEDYRGGRPDLLPGDIVLSTKDDNFISVYRGGSIGIEATPVCKLFLEQSTDTIHSFSSQATAATLSSIVKSEVFYEESDRPVLTTKEYHVQAEDNGPTIENRIGSLSSGRVYEFSIRDAPRDDGGSKTLSIDAFTTGNVDVVTNDIHVDCNLTTVGNKATAKGVVKDNSFMADLNGVLNTLLAICTGLNSLGVAVPTNTILTMQAKIGATDYVSKKLKAE